MRSLAFLLFPSLLLAQGLAPSHPDFVKSVYASVVLLYEQTDSGSMKMECTATAYRKTEKGYRFISASHCVEGDTAEERKQAKYFVSADEKGTKTFLPARLIESGDKKRGDDFAIFEVEMEKGVSVIPLGDDSRLVPGDEIINVASPMGLGKQFFKGYITALHVDRPPLDANEVTWHDVMLVNMGIGPGSSGSAVISEDQHAIIGFAVGNFSANIGAIVLPVSAFKEFEKQVDAGKYKHSYEKEADSLK